MTDWEKMVLQAARCARSFYQDKERLESLRAADSPDFEPHGLFNASMSYARECSALEQLITEDTP